MNHLTETDGNRFPSCLYPPAAADGNPLGFRQSAMADGGHLRKTPPAGNQFPSPLPPAKVSPCILIDTREPWPHPWAEYWGAGVSVHRATLETGDMALAGAPDLAVVERKTVPDFLAAVGRERARFTRELLRARYCGAFAIVVEGNLCDVLRQSRGVLPSSIVGTIAAWTRRGFPVVFCGNPATAADFTLRYLSQPLAEAERLLKACKPTGAGMPRGTEDKS